MSDQAQNTQEHEYDDNEPSIERCPHDKENPYVMVSRSLIRDNSLSPECRLMLIYLLSMDGKKWKINPKQLVHYFKPHWGRNKIYEWLDQAIEAGYMKKETSPNLKHPNLRGKIKYFVSESPKFKKCFRHTEIQDTEAQDPPNRDYKNNNHTSSEEEVLNKESSSIRKDDDLIFSDREKEDLNNYSEQEVSEALRITKECCTQSKNSSQVKFFFTTIRNLKQSPKKVKIPPVQELKKYFKHGEFYNQAECYINETHIGFGRGMKHESIDFKYFTWENFLKMCEGFGIEFKR